MPSFRPVLLAVAVVAAAMPASAQPTLSLSPLGTVKSGVFRAEDPRVAEINAYDVKGQRLFVVNPFASRVDIIDAADPSSPVAGEPLLLLDVCQTELGDDCPLRTGLEPNSVAVDDGLLAVAVANAPKTDNGHVLFFELRRHDTPKLLAVVEVGAGPDMLVFSDDGRHVLTANEGEPSADYTIDPPGTVSIIDVKAVRRQAGDHPREKRRGWHRGEGRRLVRTVSFERYDDAPKRAELEAAGIRVFGPNASVSQDLEPEYIAVSKSKAYVTLQENNALAIVNLESARVERLVALGLADHALPGHALDASDADGAINIRNWPVRGMYQPDAIAAFQARGRTFLITANEGDAREYAGFAETRRLGNAAHLLDPAVFPDAAALKANTALGRLTVTTASGDSNGDGLFERIDVFGGRSVSILDQQGRRVWDSGELFERLSADLDATGRSLFNTTSTANSRDNRSDDKGVEPESVVVGEVDGRLYAFVGLERDGGIVVLDLGNPTAPVLAGYVNRRLFPRNPVTNALLACSDTVDCGDLGPEGLTFVPARKSPTGKALLVVSNEVSSTTTIWQIQ